jgi:hypothetical protein
MRELTRQFIWRAGCRQRHNPRDHLAANHHRRGYRGLERDRAADRADLIRRRLRDALIGQTAQKDAVAPGLGDRPIEEFMPSARSISRRGYHRQGRRSAALPAARRYRDSIPAYASTVTFARPRSSDVADQCLDYGFRAIAARLGRCAA